MVLNVPGGLFGEKEKGLLDTKKTKIYSLNATDFLTGNPATDNFVRLPTFAVDNTGSLFVMAGIHLPHEAIIRAISVWGDNAGSWILSRCEINANSSEVINGTINTPKLLSQNEAGFYLTIIDNINYSYQLKLTMAASKVVYGVSIEYDEA